MCAIIAGLGSNLYNFLSRFILAKEGDSSAFGWFAEITRLGTAFLILPWDRHFSFTTQGVLIFMVLGITEIVSIFLFMKMHEFSQLSISTIVSRMRLVWIPILAFIFLGETLLPKEYIGILVLFFGLGIAVSHRKVLVDKGVSYATVSSFVVAALSIVMKIASPLMSTSWLLVGMSGISSVIYPFVLGKKRIQEMLKVHKGIKLIASLSNVFAMYFYVYALKIGDVSKVTAVYQGMMIVSILAGIIFLKERERITEKLFGSIVTLAGALLLTT